MSSVATCKLNQTFKDKLAGKRWKYFGDYEMSENTGWSSYLRCANVLKDSVHPRRKPFDVSNAYQLNCCGMNELVFNSLQSRWKDIEEFGEFIAKFIKHNLETEDRRVVITGIPTIVGTESQYDIEFYRKLRDTLESFGFVQLGRPYKNANSKNTIVALAGQMP